MSGFLSVGGSGVGFTGRLTALDVNHIHAWECNDVGPTTLADTGNTSAPCPLTVGGTAGDVVFGIPGILGNCISFRGTGNGFADTALTAGGTNPGTDFPIGANPYTFEYWISSGRGDVGVQVPINATHTAGTQQLLQLQSNASFQWVIAPNNGANGTNLSVASSNYPLPKPASSEWFYIAVTYSATKAFALYVNGVLVDTFAGLGTPDAPAWTTAGSGSRRFGIAGNVDNAARFRGNMSRVRMSNIARSQTYLAGVYSKGVGF